MSKDLEKTYAWLNSRTSQEDKGPLEERHRESIMLERRFEAILPIAQKLLAGTAWTKEQPSRPNDIELFKEFLVQIAPYSHEKLFPDFWAHCLATGVGMRIITNNYKSEMAGLSHDLSTLICPNHYLRKNLIEKPFGRKLGLLPKYSSQIVSRILGLKKPAINFCKDMTDQEIIQDCMDNLCKVNPEGKLKKLEVTRQGMTNQEKKVTYQKDSLWPSTTRGLSALYSEEKNRAVVAARIFEEELQFPQSSHSVNIDALKKKIQNKLDNPENQDWLLRVRNAQETLDPEVAEKLGRPSIEAVIFDVGGVLLAQDNDALWGRIASVLTQHLAAANQKSFGENIEPNDVAKVMEPTLNDGWEGKITEEEYLKTLCKGLRISSEGLTWPEVFEHPEIYSKENVVPQMRNIIKKLHKSGKEIWIYTDSILPVARVIRNFLEENFPEIIPDHILVSSEVGISKKSDPAGAFALAQEQIDLDSQEILFIDDNEAYTTAARAKCGLRTFTFRQGIEDNGTRISAQERLRRELKLANLI